MGNEIKRLARKANKSSHLEYSAEMTEIPQQKGKLVYQGRGNVSTIHVRASHK